ncbi:MAG: DUF4190 domain-containing protein [Bacteroidota bacterium]
MIYSTQKQGVLILLSIFLMLSAIPALASEHRPSDTPPAKTRIKQKRKKLKFKEKIGLWLLKKAIKKNQKPVNKKAKLGFIFSLLALFIPFASFILLILGFIFSFKGLKELRAPQNEEGGKGLAIAGITLGFVAIVASIIAISTLANL